LSDRWPDFARNRTLPPLRSLALESKLLFGIQAVDELVVHQPAFSPEEYMEPLIAPAHAHSCKFLEPTTQCIPALPLALVANARAICPKDLARSTLAQTVCLPRPRHHRPHLKWALPFFRSASCKMLLSSERSATSCFSFRFSSLSCFSSRSSETPRPPYFFFCAIAFRWRWCIREVPVG